MTVKLFTMVKDEVDIIVDWINYHGNIFGFENIFIIDNYSTDGTYEKICSLEHLKINILREKDYSKKGIFMTDLIKKHCNDDDIAYPIDSDEFIVYYEDTPNSSVQCDKIVITNYINNLPDHVLYKAEYLIPRIEIDGGYKRATVETKTATKIYFNNFAKSFLKKKHLKGTTVDHGNHMLSENHFMTKLWLVHYHARNTEQLKKKTLNNILGLGYPNDKKLLKNILLKNKNCDGNHHVSRQIEILENTWVLNTTSKGNDVVDISNLACAILETV